jgi:hypothetical protein
VRFFTHPVLHRVSREGSLFDAGDGSPEGDHMSTPNHIKLVFKKLAERDAVHDAVTRQPADPKGGKSYRQAYAFALTGIDRALRGRPLTDRERRRNASMSRAYDEVHATMQTVERGLEFMALLSGKTITAIPVADSITPNTTTPEPMRATVTPITEAPHKAAKPTSATPKTQPDSDWFDAEWPEGTFEHVRPIFLAVCGDEADEPIACPENVSKKVKGSWKAVVTAVTAQISDLPKPQGGFSPRVYEEAKEQELAGMLKWNSAALKFEYTEKMKQSLIEVQAANARLTEVIRQAQKGQVSR